MDKTVQISVVHYAEEDELPLNDTVALLIHSIRDLTEYPYKLNIIDNQMHPRARRDLEEKLPDIEIIRTKGNRHTYGAGCNTAIRNFDADYLCILHTDCLVSWNWLTCNMKNLIEAEKKYGVPCITTFKLLPYPISLGTPWSKMVADDRRKSPEEVISYLTKWRFPWKMWNSIPIAISHPGSVTDHGWQIGLYMTNRGFFNEVGLMDETLPIHNDIDYGLRCLATRCRNLISDRVIIHHIGALHRFSGVYGTSFTAKPFFMKWGEEIRKTLLDGSIWIDLHKKQREKYGE